MESFELSSAVRGYHVYRYVWEPSVGEKLVAQREFDNQFDKFTVKLLKDEEKVSYLPREIQQSHGIFNSRSWWIDFCQRDRPSSTL